jgi:hypothetical protein
VKTIRGSIFILFALIMFCLAIPGCKKAEGPDFHVNLNDARGLTAESKVLWNGMDVGKVVEVLPVEGKAQVRVILHSDFKNTLRSDVKAKAVRGVLTEGEPVLKLYGGSDASQPLLEKGSEIPEAPDRQHRLGSRLSKRAIVFIAGFSILALFILFVLLRIFKAVLAIGVVLVLAIATFWVAKHQWMKYHDQLVSPETEAVLEEFANQTFRSPQMKEVWTNMKSDANELLGKALEKGGQASAEAKQELAIFLNEKADELKQRGKEASAEDVLKLKGKLSEYLETDIEPESASE